MTTVNEIPRVHQWLKTILAADATLVSSVTGIYRGRVKKGAGYPAVVYSFLAAPDDVNGNGPARIWAKARYIVKAVGEGDSDLALQTIADRIDAVLQAVAGGSSDVAIDYCIRKRAVYFQDDSVANKIYTHLGGEYEIAARYNA